MTTKIKAGVIGDGVVGTTQIAANAVTSAKLAQNSVLTKHIDDNQIGIDQLNVSDGSDGQFLKTNGSGTLAFADAASAFADLTNVTVATSDPALNTNPSTGVGTLWLNKSTGNIWCCTDATTDDNFWTNIGKGSSDVGFSATGGNSTVTSGGYKYHVFTASGNLVILGSKSAQALIIGGGGGGGGTGYNGGGGGGAGGVVLASAITLTAQTYSITVGAGGAAGGTGSDGGNSSFPGETVAVGGGGGGQSGAGGNGRSGGSGGGGGRDSGGSSGGAGTSGQGNAGGSSLNSCGSAGGGGGAGQAGVNGAYDCNNMNATQSDGGDGTSTYSAWGAATSTGVNVSGTYYYAGGGAGAVEAQTHLYGRNEGGLGGGGIGAMGYDADGTAGTANTGSGGGGGQLYAGTQRAAGAGGSGIVIVRYAV